MQGRIYKRFKSSWQIVISLDRDPLTGKRRQKWIAVKGNQEKAKRLLRDLMHQYDTAGNIVTSRTTVKELFTRWMPIYKTTMVQRSFERYEQVANKYVIPALGNIPLIKLRAEHIQNYYAALLRNGTSAKTIRLHQNLIHKALSMGMKWNLVYRNVANDVELPAKNHVEFQVWDAEEMNQFLDANKTLNFYPLFYTALLTGMRRSELFGLQWDDIDFLGAQISVKRSLQRYSDNSWRFEDVKSQRSRRNIAMSPALLAVFRQIQHKGSLNLVFCKDNGEPLHPNTIYNAWVKACKVAKVKRINFHEARHTHATLLLKQGVHPKIVQERLGHSSIEMTLNTYSHIVPGLQEAAAKKFDELLTGPAINSDIIGV